jgi:hypothetical protein
MPTTYNDQFYVIDPYAPPPVGTTLVAQRFDLVDQNDDGDVDRFNGDSIDGSDIRSSYPGDTVSVTLPNGTTVTHTGITFYLADGREVFTPTDGSILQTGTFAGKQRCPRTGRARCQLRRQRRSRAALPDAGRSGRYGGRTDSGRER